MRADISSSGGQTIKRYDVGSFLIRLPYLDNYQTGHAFQTVIELMQHGILNDLDTDALC